MTPADSTRPPRARICRSRRRRRRQYQLPRMMANARLPPPPGPHRPPCRRRRRRPAAPPHPLRARPRTPLRAPLQAVWVLPPPTPTPSVPPPTLSRGEGHHRHRLLRHALHSSPAPGARRLRGSWKICPCTPTRWKSLPNRCVLPPIPSCGARTVQ